MPIPDSRSTCDARTPAERRQTVVWILARGIRRLLASTPPASTNGEVPPPKTPPDQLSPSRRESPCL